MLAVSTGNHAQSVAYAAQLFGVRAIIYMPEAANPVHLGRIEGRIEIRGIGFRYGNRAVIHDLDLDTITTGDQKRDDHLRSADFFEVETYPTMTFTTTGVQPTGQNSFRLVGDLTIKETTKEVTFDVEAAGPIPIENGQRVGFHATTTIDRRDFGITWGSELPGGIPAVGHQVQLVLDVEGVTGG